jgi:hypothetical protein
MSIEPTPRQAAENQVRMQEVRMIRELDAVYQNTGMTVSEYEFRSQAIEIWAENMYKGIVTIH